MKIKSGIYPNPATNELTINTDKDAFTICTIANMMGQTLMQLPIINTTTKVNIATLPAGVYVVTFTGNSGEVVRRMVKM